MLSDFPLQGFQVSAFIQKMDFQFYSQNVIVFTYFTIFIKTLWNPMKEYFLVLETENSLIYN